MQHVLVDNPPSHALHQLRVRDGVKVFRQIGIHDIRITRIQKFVYFLNRILRAFLRPVPVGVRFEIRLKDRFQNQFCGGLRHPVPYGRNAQWSFATARLRNHNSPHRLWFVCFVV